MARNNYTVSARGIKLIKDFEGEILKVYKDPIGLLTVGVGHLLTPEEKSVYRLGQRITREESTEILKKDLRAFERAVTNAVTVPITQNQFDALVSFAFNVGEANFKRSSVLKNLNNRNFARAADGLLLWNKADGKVLPGLVRRRKAERELFLTPDAAGTINRFESNIEIPAAPANPATEAHKQTSDLGNSVNPQVTPPEQNSPQPVVEVPQVKPETEPEKEVAGIGASIAGAITFVTTSGMGVLTWLGGARTEIIYGVCGLVALVGLGFVVSRFLYANRERQRAHDERMQREQRAHEIQMAILTSAMRQDLNTVKIVPQPI